MDKKLRDLNDVNKVLEEKSAEEVTGLRKGRRYTAMHNDVFDGHHSDNRQRSIC